MNRVLRECFSCNLLKKQSRVLDAMLVLCAASRRGASAWGLPAAMCVVLLHLTCPVLFCYAEAMCRQLAQVTAALVATFPGIPASTSATSSTSATTSTSTATGPASSSGPGNRPSLQHHALLSVLWHDVSRLLFTACQLDGQVSDDAGH